MKLFNIDLVDFIDEPVGDWKDAVAIASKKLIEYNYVTPEYVKQVIDITVNNGPYYILAPHLALLHVPPSKIVTKTGLAFTYFNKPVSFQEGERHQIRYCFSLAATDGTTHLDYLRKLAILFMNQEFMNKLLICQSKADLINLIKEFD